MDSGLAVVEEGGGHVASAPEHDAVGAVFGLADDGSRVISAEKGAAYLIEVVGLGGIGRVCFVEEAEAVNVVGFGEVWIDADEELPARVDDTAGACGAFAPIDRHAMR